MCEPTAQNYDAHDRYDDPTISDSDRLLRHCRTPVQIVPCAINGLRVSSQAFKSARGEQHTSVDLECLLHQAGLPSTARFGLMPRTYALIAVTASDARSVANGVAWTPKPADGNAEGAAAAPNPYHGEIIGPTKDKQSRALAANAVVVHAEWERE